MHATMFGRYEMMELILNSHPSCVNIENMACVYNKYVFHQKLYINYSSIHMCSMVTQQFLKLDHQPVLDY